MFYCWLCHSGHLSDLMLATPIKIKAQWRSLMGLMSCWLTLWNDSRFCSLVFKFNILAPIYLTNLLIFQPRKCRATQTFLFRKPRVKFWAPRRSYYPTSPTRHTLLNMENYPFHTFLTGALDRTLAYENMQSTSLQSVQFGHTMYFSPT